MAQPNRAGQVWSADDYTQKASFVPELGGDVLALLAPKSGERIIDLGCGDGALTLRIAESGATVIGLEPSPELAEVARSRNLEVIDGDAQEPFGSDAYSAVFSNAMFHWLRDPERALRNAYDALRPGGRLVVEQGGLGNVAAVVTAIHATLEAAGLAHLARCPWDFPSVTTQRSRLQRAGFEVREIALHPRPTRLAAGMSGWLETFAGPYLGELAETDRVAIMRDVVRRLDCLHDPQEGWYADYVRLRFLATRPD